MTTEDSHFFGGASSGASSGASWCISGILCLINKTLRGEFGGYTAHHLSQRSQELARHPSSVAADLYLRHRIKDGVLHSLRRRRDSYLPGTIGKIKAEGRLWSW